VLGVVDHLDVDAEVALQGVDEGGDGAVALAGHRAVLAVDEQLGGDRGAAVTGGGLVAEQLHGRLLRQVLPLERRPQLGRGDLGPGVLGDRLDRAGQLDLQAAGAGRARAPPS
jgi:hypothetical protein